MSIPIINLTKVTKHTDILLSGLFGLVYYLFWGYEGIGNDMIEIIPALKKMVHPELYPNDFYLNFTKTLLLHERSFILQFYHFIHGINPLHIFIVYCICLFFFILGLFRIFAFFIPSHTAVSFGLIIILFIAKYTSIGGNELFYSSPASAIFSKTLCIWALLFKLKRKNTWSYLLLIPATYFHVLVGFQFFLILVASEILTEFSISRIKEQLKLSIPFIVATIPYLFAIFISRKNPHGHGTSFLDLIEFRLGHHFIIQYNSVLNMTFYLILYFFCLYYWKQKSKLLYHFCIIQGAILLLYLVLVNIFRIEQGLQLQWLKTTIWIELLGVLGFCSLLYANFSNLIQQRTSQYIIAALLLAIPVSKQWKEKEDHFKLTEEIDLAKWSKSNTPIEATFVYPIDFTRFKSISERSSWIDYKTISHQKAYFIPWADRIDKIFQIGLSDRKNKVDLIKKAQMNYSKMNESTLDYLINNQSVDYIILPTRLELSAIVKPVFSTTSFTIYCKK
ncbi:MAG: hypothetical protein HOP11_07610 [Saprospiraceae bacterium]|nr:hypothetical protein [Saprospiraceae bacterium]